MIPVFKWWFAELCQLQVEKVQIHNWVDQGTNSTAFPLPFSYPWLKLPVQDDLNYLLTTCATSNEQYYMK